MKQLLIVKKAAVLNGGKSYPTDLSGMAAGAIGFFEVGGSAWLSAPATKNFGIALGRGNNSPAFIIPEVDIDTLEVIETLPTPGVNYSASITIPSPSAGKTYTLVLVKLGTGLNGERNKWSQSFSIPSGGSSTANAVAKALRDGFQAMVDAGSINVVVGGTSAAVTITGVNPDEKWKLEAADDLYGTSITESPAMSTPAIGDKAYVQKLARACAANKGFTNTGEDAHELYPGYPEAVEDLTPNTAGGDGASTEGYGIITLRFATGRVAGKQTDERIWQYVHIAMPVSSSYYDDVQAILPVGKFSNVVAGAIAKGKVDAAAATSKAPQTGYLTKTVADTLYDPLGG